MLEVLDFEILFTKIATYLIKKRYINININFGYCGGRALQAQLFALRTALPR
jgi:hypothetical protein